MYNDVIKVLEKILHDGKHKGKTLTEIEKQNIKNSIEFIKQKKISRAEGW